MKDTSTRPWRYASEAEVESGTRRPGLTTSLMYEGEMLYTASYVQDMFDLTSKELRRWKRTTKLSVVISILSLALGLTAMIGR